MSKFWVIFRIYSVFFQTKLTGLEIINSSYRYRIDKFLELKGIAGTELKTEEGTILYHLLPIEHQLPSPTLQIRRQFRFKTQRCAEFCHFQAGECREVFH